MPFAPQLQIFTYLPHYVFRVFGEMDKNIEYLSLMLLLNFQSTYHPRCKDRDNLLKICLLHHWIQFKRMLLQNSLLLLKSLILYSTWYTTLLRSMVDHGVMLSVGFSQQLIDHICLPHCWLCVCVCVCLSVHVSVCVCVCVCVCV